jgi:hypothetical protein
MEKPLVFTSKKAKLSAVWHQSSNPDGPVIVFHHGFGGAKIEAHRIFVKCARKLAEKGFDSLRFDFYGAGDSEGDLMDATFSTWIENSLEAITYIRSKRKSKVFLLGFSLGAFVAAAAAGRILPAGLVLWAPIFHPLKRILREKELMGQAREDGFADYQGELVNYTLVEDAAAFRIPSIFEGYRGPVCLVHGSQDTSALPGESKQYARFYRNRGCEVEHHTIKDANHSFDRHDWETQVLDHTVRWIVSRG